MTSDPHSTSLSPSRTVGASREGAGALPGLTLHHVGIAVADLDRALSTYLGVLGFRKVCEPVEVRGEGVRVCFVAAGSGVLLELVEGLGEGSPVAGILERNGSGPYHLCYHVDDLDGALASLRRARCRVVHRFEQRAHGLARFAFLRAPDGEIFELCEDDRRPPVRSLNADGRYHFETLFFEATRSCNLSCPMCMAGSNDRERVRKSRAQELSTDEVERHVLARAGEIGVRIIAWSGGEFLVRRDAIELVRRATAYGYESTVCSNAFLLTRERLEALREASGDTLVVALGINSIDDENAWTRDAECDRTLAALALLKEMGIRRHVVVNVGRHNLKTLAKTLAWLESQGIPYNRSPFTARGSGRAFWDDLRFGREEMESVIHPALRAHPIGYISYTPFFLSPELHRRLSDGAHNATVPQNPSIGCWCGSWLAVSAEGEVAPCGILLDELDCGNVRDRTLEEIIDQSPVFQQVLDREQLKGRCGRCRYKSTCGGCRAMAYFETGDVMAEDPTCFFEPESTATMSPLEEETNKMFRRYVFMKRRSDKDRARSRTPAAD